MIKINPKKTDRAVSNFNIKLSKKKRGVGNKGTQRKEIWFAKFAGILFLIWL